MSVENICKHNFNSPNFLPFLSHFTETGRALVRSKILESEENLGQFDGSQRETAIRQVATVFSLGLKVRERYS